MIHSRDEMFETTLSDGCAVSSPNRSDAGLVPALALAALGGAFVSLQAWINGALTQQLGTGHVAAAALISYGLGLTALSSSLISPARRARLWTLRNVRLPVWCFLGGLGGAVFVVSAAYTAPLIGVATMTICIVSGQVIGGFLTDSFGMSPGGKRALSPRRLCSGAAAIVAVIITGFGDPSSYALRLSWMTVLVAVGVALAVHQAANGRLAVATGSPTVASIVSFSVGTLAITGIFAVTSTTVADAPTWPGWAQAWMYTGGLCGALFVLVAAVTVPVLGVLRTTLSVLAGQLGGGLLIDLLDPGADQPQLTTILAVGLAVCAMILPALARTDHAAGAASRPHEP